MGASCHFCPDTPDKTFTNGLGIEPGLLSADAANWVNVSAMSPWIRHSGGGGEDTEYLMMMMTQLDASQNQQSAREKTCDIERKLSATTVSTSSLTEIETWNGAQRYRSRSDFFRAQLGSYYHQSLQKPSHLFSLRLCSG